MLLMHFLLSNKKSYTSEEQINDIFDTQLNVFMLGFQTLMESTDTTGTRHKINSNYKFVNIISL